MNSILESLNHNDFNFQQEKVKKSRSINKTQLNIRPKYGEPSSYRKIKSSSKLPSINELKIAKTDLNSGKSHSKQNEQTTRQNSSRAQSRLINNISAKRLNSASYRYFLSQNTENTGFVLDIDKFIFSKNLEAIDTPWSLNESKFKKRNTESIHSAKIKTENLIDKLKSVFKEKYFTVFNKESPEDKRKKSVNSDSLLASESYVSKLTDDHINFIKPRTKSRRKSRSINESPKSSRSRSSKDGLSALNKIYLNDLKGVYVRKLKNNYYDRKLWNSLIISNSKKSVNYYIEKSARDYNSEFKILNQPDWQSSSFGKGKCAIFIR